MISDVRRFGLTVTVTCLLATVLLVASGAAFAKGPLYEPDYDYRIFPPYQSIGVAENKELEHVSYQLTDCVWVMTSFDLFGPATQVHKKERTVTVIAPASMDLTNGRIINGLVVNGWRKAWKNCFSSYVQNNMNYTEFAGVRVLVVQRKKRIIETGRVKVNDQNGIYIDEMNNLAMERKVANQKAQADADARAKQAEADAIAQSQQLEAKRQAAISSAQTRDFIAFIFKLIVLAIVATLIYLAYTPIVTHIRWYYAPHPAIKNIETAIPADLLSNMDGIAIANAMGFVPKNPTEAKLAIRDIERIRKRLFYVGKVRKAQHQLGKEVINMDDDKQKTATLRKLMGL